MFIKMKKILSFLLSFFFVACSSDEPVIDDKVDSSSSNIEVFDLFTMRYEPYNRQTTESRYCDIICVVNDDVVAMPLNLTVYLKDGSSIITGFSSSYYNLENGSGWGTIKQFGVQSYGYGFNNTSFNSVKEMVLLYSTLDDKRELIYKTVLLYGDGKKCNKVLRSFFK